MTKKKEKAPAADPQTVEEAPEPSARELAEPLWAVISFEKCEARDLSYEAALGKIAELEAAGAAGLCVVTNETASRMNRSGR